MKQEEDKLSKQEVDDYFNEIYSLLVPCENWVKDKYFEEFKKEKERLISRIKRGLIRLINYGIDQGMSKETLMKIKKDSILMSYKERSKKMKSIIDLLEMLKKILDGLYEYSGS